MWKTTIKSWVWVEIDGKTELKKCSLNFEFKTLNEATDFVDTVVSHSDVTEFAMEYVEKVV
jgi:hypothetical protein